MLHLTGIQKSFGSHPVFAIDHLLLGPGIFWLKGANGSGKSTLMKIIAGLLPFKGNIVLNQSIDLRRQPVEYRLRINHSAAEPVYPSFLAGDEIVTFISAAKKGNPAQTEEHKKILGIDNYLANPAGSYSSGMLKKLSLLAAFAGNPCWILLDEPFTTLDQASQEALCALIRTRREQGVSFLITSHHDAETSRLDFTNSFLLKEKQLHQIFPQA